MCEVMDGVSGIAVGVGGMTVFLFSHTPPLEVAKQLGVPSDIMDVKHYPQPQKATKAKAKELQQPPTHTRPPPQRTPRTSPARAPPCPTTPRLPSLLLSMFRRSWQKFNKMSDQCKPPWTFCPQEPFWTPFPDLLDPLAPPALGPRA